MTKYENFAADLNVAMDKGYEASLEYTNSGTCNFDSVWVKLPRWHADGIKSAADFAGVTCYKEGNIWMFIPRGKGFGFNRTVNAETAAKILKLNGYEAGVWYYAD